MSTSDLIYTFNLYPVIKASIIAIQVIYVLYAFLLTRQIKQLNNSFCTPQENFFKIGAFIHLLASIILLIVSVLHF